MVGFTGMYAKTGGRKTRKRRTAKNRSPKEEEIEKMAQEAEKCRDEPVQESEIVRSIL